MILIFDGKFTKNIRHRCGNLQEFPVIQQKMDKKNNLLIYTWQL